MYKLYYHAGSNNHGCEAIVRSTIKILNKDMYLYTFSNESDIKYNLDDIINIIESEKNIYGKKSINYLKQIIHHKIFKNDYMYYKLTGKNFFNNVNKNDIYLSIGGDNYCYAGKDILGYYNKIIHKKGGKTVLWGCSFEPTDMNDEIAKDIAMYDAIFTRETLSYEVLSQVNPNTYLYPDPAFQLDKIDLPLPKHFIEGNTVGINVSPLIMSCETNEGITKENYIQLIDYIIKETDMNIALIPHVVWENNDDRKPLKELYDLFKHTQRVCLIDDHNCMELKGFISRCRFFVGARTHATIAAYSTCVPTLVVGYSVKAKGIAKDIFGTYDHYVLPVQSLNEKDDLVKSFQWLVNHETDIKNHLYDFMPSYKEKALEAGNKLKELIG
ncbi:MAG: polysaccharide pyruvyl transferase family protein [Faecalibacillus sp.]